MGLEPRLLLLNGWAKKGKELLKGTRLHPEHLLELGWILLLAASLGQIIADTSGVIHKALARLMLID